MKDWKWLLISLEDYWFKTLQCYASYRDPAKEKHYLTLITVTNPQATAKWDTLMSQQVYDEKRRNLLIFFHWAVPSSFSDGSLSAPLMPAAAGHLKLGRGTAGIAECSPDLGRPADSNKFRGFLLLSGPSNRSKVMQWANCLTTLSNKFLNQAWNQWNTVVVHNLIVTSIGTPTLLTSSGKLYATVGAFLSLHVQMHFQIAYFSPEAPAGDKQLHNIYIAYA